MENIILQEAFQQLNMLNEEDFNISNNSEEGVEELKDFVDNDEELDTLDVIDPEAETEEELEDSYINKVILDCTVCHSKIYKNVDEVSIDKEADLANIGEECPYCYSADGYKVIGQVVPFVETEVDIEVEPKEETDEPKEEIEESFKAEDNEEKDVLKFLNLNEADLDKISNKYKVRLNFRIEGDRGYDPDEWWSEPYANVRVSPDWDVEIKDYKEWAKISDAVFNEIEKLGVLWDDIFDNSADGVYEAQANAILDIEDPEVLKWFPEEEIVEESCKGKNCKKVDNSTKIKENLEKIDIETEHDTIHVETEEKAEAGEEMIAPVEPAIEDEIMGVEEEPVDLNFDSEAPEEPLDSEDDTDFVDYDLEDFDEESFDELGESYLRQVYENVQTYHTTSATVKGDSLILEGIIRFNSGNSKKTQFIFEAKDSRGAGKVSFSGRNSQICESKTDAFTLSGKFDKTKFISESLRYKYHQKTNEGLKRIHGKVDLKG